MDGIKLDALTIKLSPVPAAYADTPVHTIADLAQKDIVTELYEGCVPDFIEHCHEIPERFKHEFSPEEILKCHLSTNIMPSPWIGDLLEHDQRYRAIDKIRNSMWRWGTHQTNWNELVAAYKGLQGFTMKGLNTDFDITLDYTSGNNKAGYSEMSRTFLDGSFAFLIHHKGNHVMTAGFSFRDGETILVRQIQLKHKTGNRWLYRFPKNRVAFILQQFRENFPNHNILLVRGETLMESLLSGYNEGIKMAERSLEQHRSQARLSTKDKQGLHQKKGC